MNTEGIDIRTDPTSPGGTVPAGRNADIDREKIRRLAQQFEAMLMTQMLRDMRRSMLGDGDDEKNNDVGGYGTGALTDTMDVELGLALSRAGGFGLSPVLVGAFERLASVGGAERAVTAPTAEGTSAMPDQAARADARAHDPGAATVRPVDNLRAGRISSAYGWRNDPIAGSSRFHEGVDIAMPIGRNVVAAERGRVAFAGEQSGFGHTILIEHGSGRQTRYAHLSEQIVRAGDEVVAGQVIGKSGASGRVTGPHLHFEVLVNGKAVNPLGHGAD